MEAEGGTAEGPVGWPFQSLSMESWNCEMAAQRKESGRRLDCRERKERLRKKEECCCF